MTCWRVLLFVTNSILVANAFHCNFDANNFCPNWNGDTLLSDKKWKILNQNRVGTKSFARNGGFASFQSREVIIMSVLEAPFVQLLPEKGIVVKNVHRELLAKINLCRFIHDTLNECQFISH